jgi:hypothetical protein
MKMTAMIHKLAFMPIGCVSVLILWGILISIGCDGSPIREVRGTITFDGKPLESGEILFKAVEGGEAPDAGAPIANGNYIVPAVTRGMRAGSTYRVEISSWVGRGRKAPDPNSPTGQSDLLENIVPEKFNTSSELTVTVSPSRSENQFDFDLTSN